MAFTKKSPAKKTTTKKESPKKESSKKKAPVKKKAGPIAFKAPSDFKPAFYEIGFETLRDGLIRGGSVTVNRVKGKWDNPDAKRFNLAEYDVPTLVGLAARLGGVMFAPNVLKRLPPKTKYRLILRSTKKSATEALGAGIKGIARLGVGKNDKPKWFWLTNKSEGNDLATYRRLRKFARVAAGAFVEVLLPPSGRRSKKSKDEDSEE